MSFSSTASLDSEDCSSAEEARCEPESFSEETLCLTEELFCILLRVDFGSELQSRAREIVGQGISWEHFTVLTVQSGVVALIFKRLGEILSKGAIPEQVLERLKAIYISVVRNAMLQHREAEELLSSFEEQGICVLPLKGTFLAQRLYGDVAARGVGCDIDLLVREEDRGRSELLLENLGYVRAADDGLGEQIGQYLYRKPGKTPVELHWKVNSLILSPKTMDGFWQRMVEQEQGLVAYADFKEEELLLQLTAHLADSAYFTSVKHVCDIDRLLNLHRETLDWKRVLKNANDWKLSCSLYGVVFVSKKVFDSPVPAEVLRELRPSLAKRIFFRIFLDREVLLRRDSRRRLFLLGFVSYILYQVLEARTLSDYVRVLFPAEDQMRSKNYSERVCLGLRMLWQSLRK